MATIVNNPPPNTEREGGGSGFLVGIILLIIFVILFIFYGLPYLGQAGGGSGTQTPQVNVPEQVDVNVEQQP